MAGKNQIESPRSTLSILTNSSSIVESSVCQYDYYPTVQEFKEGLGGYHTALLVIGILLTAALYGLFFNQIKYTLQNVHKVYRTHVLWITSVYPFMTLMTVMSVLIPRADKLCNAVKVTYMCNGISHFMDLTTLMFGSEKRMLYQLQLDSITLNTGPLCCCMLCLPKPPVSKERLRWVRWLLWQMPYTQSIYFIISILWATAESTSDGKLKTNESYLWLTILNLISFLSGVYSLNILAQLCAEQLSHYNYKRKSFSLKILVLVTKFQRVILEILAIYKVFPCPSPYISPSVYKIVVECSLYFVEMGILGPLQYLQYNNIQLLHKNPKEVGQVTGVINTPRDGRGHPDCLAHGNGGAESPKGIHNLHDPQIRSTLDDLTPVDVNVQ